MDPLEKAFTIVFLVSTMLSTGLKVSQADLLAIARARGLMARSLATNFILIPILGLIMIKIIPMDRDVAIGLSLLAASPGGLNAIQFTSKTPGGLCYAATLVFVLSLLSVLASPAIAALMLPSDARLVLPYGKVIAVLFLLVLLPLAAGVIANRTSHRAADILAKPLALCGTLAFIIVVVLLLAQRRQAIGALHGIELAAMLGLILAGMVIGWLMGGPAKETRTILATGTSMRNAALALTIAINSFPDANVDVAVIAFSGLMIPPNMLFTLCNVIRNRRLSPHATPARRSP
jgi:BASS family bile acid:Na+ symporter